MARNDDKPGGFAVTRRDFLKSAGVVSAVTAAATPELEAQTAAGGGTGVGPGEVPITLMVNGKRAGSPDRAARHAARRAADARRPDRQQARLRSRRLRRVHDDRRRPSGLLLLDACDRGAGQADPQRRRPRQRRHAPPGAAGLLRQGRADVRLLHARLHHGERRPAREESDADARTDSTRASTATSAAAARSPASSKPSPA